MFYLNKIARFVNSSIRVKITIGVILPLLVVSGIFSIIEYDRHREAVMDNLTLLASQSGRVIETNLRHAMLKSDFTEVQTMLDSISENNEFRVIYLLDTSGKVIFAPFGKGLGKQLNNSQPDCQPCHKVDPAQRPSSIVVRADDGQRVFRSMLPIANAAACSTCHDAKQRVIGLLLTDIPVARVEAALTSNLREDLFWWLGSILTTIVIVNLSLSKIVIRRLERLAQALRSFGKKKLDFRIYLTAKDFDEIDQLSNSFNEMGQRIEEEAQQNETLSRNLSQQSEQRGELLKRIITAQEDERKRVARELHDDLGQALSALSFHVSALERVIPADSSGAINQLNQTQELITNAINQMYELIMALRPSILDDLGLAAALRNHAEQHLKGSGITINLDSSALTERLPADIEITLYRIFQEALSNVRRHSGAKHVQIRLSIQNGEFVGEIQDDGTGFDPQSISITGDNPRGLGLLSMQERVAQYYGRLDLISSPGNGTLIRITIALEDQFD